MGIGVPLPEAREGWALRLGLDAAPSVAGLRLVPGIEVAVDGDFVWLRGREADDALRCRLDALPVLERFRWRMPDTLYPGGSRIPSGRLPGVRWRPIHEWLGVTTEPGRLPGRVPGRVELELVESGNEREADLVRTELGVLEVYLRSAARVRWAGMSFAASSGGEALVRGRPVLAVPGARWVRLGRVFVPSGFEWRPAVEPGVVEHLFGLAANEWLLWLAPGSGAGSGVVRLTEEQFLPLTPSAVRATVRELKREAGA